MSRPDIAKALAAHFGHTSFRKPQREVVESVVSGRDTLAIMPTGGGKSLCYQLPAVVSDGVALVVSPLIALMKDQVDALSKKGIPAAMINSSQSWTEQKGAMDAMRSGALKLVYIAPERFRAQSFTRSLAGVKISLFAVDEAHCISQWGHDFRPDYMRLREALETLGRPPCAAFTATATPEVKGDIISQLDMRSPAVFVSGFARPNLSFNVTQVSGRAEKDAKTRELIAKFKTGIIYCSTRKSAEDVSKGLALDSIPHVLYHGGMTPAQRDEAQDEFVSGRADVAVATNAFGMGIDRPDIRFVCHHDLPGSVEAFYQEAGRAGRDGGPARCEMLFSYADKRVQDFFIEGANPRIAEIRAVYSAICAAAGSDGTASISIDDMADAANAAAGRKALSSMSAASAVSLLKKHGFIERLDAPSGPGRLTRLIGPALPPSHIVFPPGMLEEKRRRDEQKLKDLLRFAYSRGCRQEWILGYFGEADASPCGRCDRCASGRAEPAAPISGEALEDVRKALSGIARMSFKTGRREWAPRFGRDRIAKSLCGSRDAKILEAGLDRVSTYGILKERGKAYVGSLIDALLDAGLAEISDGEYPLLGITPKGVEVMLGGLVPSMDIPKPAGGGRGRARPAAGGPTDAGEPEYPELYSRLVELRNAVRRARGNPPIYALFPNQVLKNLANLRPADAEEAMKIKGIGPQKAQTLLPPFLDEIRKFERENGLA